MNHGSEDQARSLKNHIAELESRLAHPQHWTEDENNQNAEKLRQLLFERQRLISIQDIDLSDFNWQRFVNVTFQSARILTYTFVSWLTTQQLSSP